MNCARDDVSDSPSPLAAAAVASYLSARRAMRIDPAEVLKAE